MKQFNGIFATFIGVALLLSCGGKKESQSLAEGASGDMEAYLNDGVNAIEQARPTIMVIPSDQNLQRFGCLKTTLVDSVEFLVRDYEHYLLADKDAQQITSFVQDAFIHRNYPLDDFGQTLKSLDTKSAEDIADNLSQDAKTMLLMTARPDIVIQFDYRTNASLRGSSSTKKISYTLTALDAYTNKSIAAISGNNLEGESVVGTINNDLEDQMSKLMGDIEKYFSDILTRGREITIRINVDEASNQSLDDESIEGDTYTDEIIDYIKTHTVKGAYKLQTNTSKELRFTNCRIMLLNEDGTQYGAYDFARDIQKYLKKNLGLSTSNRSQGLGEIVLTIKGM